MAMMILLNIEDLCGDSMNAVRKAIESMYKDTCSVFEQKKVKDPITHVTDFEEVEVYTNVKCRLSFSTIQGTSKGDVSSLVQITKLFISPEVDIKPGSKIKVTREGATTDYTRSGVPAIYSNHQEIVLEPFKEYA